MKAAVFSECGLRPTMEDAHYLDLDFGGEGWVYGGVYDGHNGSTAAIYAAEHLHEIFLQKHRSGLKPGEAFIQSYQAISRALAYQESGAAAVDFFIRDGQIFTANAGDCRAIIVGKKGITQLTRDHRLDDADERVRVLATGASISYPYVLLGNSGLMTTRAIGDQHFRPVGVISTPSLGEHQTSADDLFLMCASDGLWDIMTNEEVAAIARNHPSPEEMASVLRDEVFGRRLVNDNLTAIAFSLQ